MNVHDIGYHRQITFSGASPCPRCLLRPLSAINFTLKLNGKKKVFKFIKMTSSGNDRKLFRAVVQCLLLSSRSLISSEFKGTSVENLRSALKQASPGETLLSDSSQLQEGSFLERAALVRLSA